jgi:hypothetical protein
MAAADIHHTAHPDCGGPDRCDWCAGYVDIRTHNRAHTDNVIGRLRLDADHDDAVADYKAGVEASLADQASRVDRAGPYCFGDMD